ncbi:RagB/SusD family nutrient uptake outer membrane protein [Mariniflexile rhizosphaerae]|uniref:RagB/SusD family nutrient uptake outer membrane protein n=1 Tax=unclassified Mariniflexile TaxID=2643887 RepID=UPI001F16ACF8|nr:RagB/SusD family nutrient uptake outer membrane protein [Mariniflexile sp. TRM1-10]
MTSSCDDFVDVDLPTDRLTAEAVFEDATTATAALRSIYAQIRTGFVYNLSEEMGLYADELDQVNNLTPIYTHNVTALDPTVSGWWSDAYNGIYEANAVIEGVDNSSALSLEDKNQIKGEALFIRAYLHSLLVELYGPIPYIRTTDYIANTKVARMPVEVVYGHIITDLTAASGLLGADVSVSGERVRAYTAVADALLARVYLYTQQWELADATASKVINSFVWEPDLKKVFKKNSSGSIWQIKPPQDGFNTLEGNRFIFPGSPGVRPVLSASLMNAFEPNDRRKSDWIGKSTVGANTWYYAYKYQQARDTKVNDNPTSLEYTVVFRLAEQYLIRAEARAHQGGDKIAGAQADINKIRTRAGLPNTTAATLNELLNAIIQERQVELFTEKGLRWFDLKRTGRAAEILAPIKSGWQHTDILFPVPESEILLNPNLLPQNDGYDN